MQSDCEAGRELGDPPPPRADVDVDRRLHRQRRLPHGAAQRAGMRTKGV